MTLFIETVAQHIKAREGQGKGKVDSWGKGPGDKQSPYPNSIPTFLHCDCLSMRTMTKPDVCGHQVQPNSPKSPRNIILPPSKFKKKFRKNSKKKKIFFN